MLHAGYTPGNVIAVLPCQGKIRILLALIDLLRQSLGEDPLSARLFDTAKFLAESGLLEYRFVEGTSWSSELWADLDAARADRLIWFHETERGQLVPRRVIALSRKGRLYARRALVDLDPKTIMTLRRAVEYHVLHMQNPSHP